MDAGTQRAGIYTRISKNNPRVPKVEDQAADGYALAKAQGYQVVDGCVYVDDGISASTFKGRPGWVKMLDDIRAGKLDVLIAVEEERFSRQPMEKELLALTCSTNGVTWHTVRGGVVDPATADGEFMSALRGSLARLEVRRKAERQRAANDHRRLRGEPISGTRPFGFEKDRITHRPDEAAEVQYAYATVLSGGSLYSIIKDWNARGVLTSRQRDRIESDREPMSTGWSYATLQQVLKRPRNAALIEKDGKILEGITAVWEPLVSREDWQAVCDILSDPQRRISPNREPRWLCAGIARCGTCDDVMRSGRGSGPRGSFPIYRCASKKRGASDGQRHASIQTGELDSMVIEAVVSSFLFGASANLPSERVDVAELTRLHVRQSEVRQGLADVADLIGTPGFSKATTAKRAAELAAEEEEIEAKIAERARRSAHVAMLVESQAALFKGKRVSIGDAAELKVELAHRFESLELEQQRTLVRSLLQVTVNTGRTTERVDIVHVGVPSLDRS